MPTPPLSDAEHERARTQRLADERAASESLGRLNGALELQAAVLALILPRASKRAVYAWQIETEGLPSAEALREQVDHLSPTARLPQLEALISRMRAQPLAARRALLEATRRVMGVRGTVRPIDRLHWLAMRQHLGAPSNAGRRHGAAADLAQLPQGDIEAIARYSAFLSRLVPVDMAASAGITGDAASAGVTDDAASAGVTGDAASAEATGGAASTSLAGGEPVTDRPVEPAAASAPVRPGTAWYDTVMLPWHDTATIPPCRPPDSDGLVHALQTLQALPWMQRPMLLHGWVAAALQHSRHGRLAFEAADALRLSGWLLDSPLPPELVRHYGVTVPQPGR